MKTILSFLIVLAALNCSGQTVQGEYLKLDTKNTYYIPDPPNITSAVSTIAFTTVIPKYDTVRVLIAYADTSWNKLWYISKGELIISDSLIRPLVPIGSIRWAFAYDVRKEGLGYVVYSSTGKREDHMWEHLKYITEDKKELPKTWVVVLGKSLD